MSIISIYLKISKNSSEILKIAHLWILRNVCYINIRMFGVGKGCVLKGVRKDLDDVE